MNISRTASQRTAALLSPLAGVGFVLAAAALSIPLRPWLQSVPSTMFVLAVMLASWYGGRAAGLLATAAAVVAMDFILFEPLYTLAPNPAYIPSTLVFATCALVVASLTASRRSMHEELQRVNDALEERVLQRTVDLNQANCHLRREVELRTAAEKNLAEKRDGLLRSNRDLEEFSSIASHDLQEPLRTISTFSELLASRHADRLPDDAVELLASIRSSARRMQTLLADLLTYARADGDSCQIEAVPLSALVIGARENLRGAIEETNAQIGCDPLPVVYGNPAQLMQVFQNLIGNALKYRREDPLLVHVWAYLEGSAWVVNVRDNGGGFDPDHADTVFLPFKRLHGRSIPGSGMGLAICKKIIDRHGGRIWAESVPSQGSVFHFTLPYTEKDSETSKPGRR